MPFCLLRMPFALLWPLKSKVSTFSANLFFPGVGFWLPVRRPSDALGLVTNSQLGFIFSSRFGLGRPDTDCRIILTRSPRLFFNFLFRVVLFLGFSSFSHSEARLVVFTRIPILFIPLFFVFLLFQSLFNQWLSCATFAWRRSGVLLFTLCLVRASLLCRLIAQSCCS